MSTGQEGADRHVIKGTLFRWRGPRVTFTEEQPVPEVKREPTRRPALVAQMLALAHHLQRGIDKGIVTDRASVARSLGFTRARVTQLLDLLLLAPDIQEQVLAMEAVDGVEPIGERALRDVAHAGTWEAQSAAISPPKGECVIEEGIDRSSQPGLIGPSQCPLSEGTHTEIDRLEPTERLQAGTHANVSTRRRDRRGHSS